MISTRLVIICALLGGCNSLGEKTSTPDRRQAQLQRYETLLHQHVPILSSDEFGGRAPATAGEDKTVAYIRQQFAALGVQPGNDGEWFQTVPITRITPVSTDILVTGKDRQERLRFHEDIVISTPHQLEATGIRNSDLVFAGYGIVAPEYGWNDYAGLDVRGKTVIVLVNDPGFATRDPDLFKGRTMTYYGRWSYKFEEAARRGAAGILVIHETEAAGYPWSVLSSSPDPRPDFALTATNRNRHLCAIQGWINRPGAQRLFAAAGLDLEQLSAAAARRDFQAVPLPMKASAAMKVSVQQVQSRNVLGSIPGRTRPDEAIIYTAHWDHLGKVENPADGDAIYNGALDNATGIAGLFALAESFIKAESPPERTVLFLATTSEESGLLGSQYYTNHPVLPLAKTVAVINMDSLPIYGPMRNVVVMGFGNNELQEYLAEAAQQQSRVVMPEPTPERGLYFRSDHFSFAKKGVPALFARAGYDHLENGEAWAKANADDYLARHYHQPSDEYDPQWDLRGAAQDLQLYFDLGYRLSQSNEWPVWYEGSEFKAIREATAP